MRKIISLLLITTSTFFLISCWDDNKPEQVTPQKNWNEQKNITPEVKKDTIKQSFKTKAEIEKIFKEWWQITCNLNRNEEGTEIKWTIYIDNKKIRADFKSESKEWMKFEWHTLNINWYSYTWNNQTTSWIKMKFNEEWLMGLDKESYSWSTNEEKTDCTEWVKWADFTIPSNIQFQEINPQNINIPQPQSQK